MAILAVAFVVLAAVPAALTDSDAATRSPVTGDTVTPVTDDVTPIVQNTKYYVEGDLSSKTITLTSSITGVELYLKEGAKIGIKTPASSATITVYVASSISDSKVVSYYADSAATLTGQSDESKVLSVSNGLYNLVYSANQTFQMVSGVSVAYADTVIGYPSGVAGTSLSFVVGATATNSTESSPVASKVTFGVPLTVDSNTYKVKVTDSQTDKNAAYFSGAFQAGADGSFDVKDAGSGLTVTKASDAITGGLIIRDNGSLTVSTATTVPKSALANGMLTDTDTVLKAPAAPTAGDTASITLVQGTTLTEDINLDSAASPVTTQAILKKGLKTAGDLTVTLASNPDVTITSTAAWTGAEIEVETTVATLNLGAVNGSINVLGGSDAVYTNVVPVDGSILSGTLKLQDGTKMSVSNNMLVTSSGSIDIVAAENTSKSTNLVDITSGKKLTVLGSITGKGTLKGSSDDLLTADGTLKNITCEKSITEAGQAVGKVSSTDGTVGLEKLAGYGYQKIEISDYLNITYADNPKGYEFPTGVTIGFASDADPGAIGIAGDATKKDEMQVTVPSGTTIDLGTDPESKRIILGATYDSGWTDQTETPVTLNVDGKITGKGVIAAASGATDNSKAVVNLSESGVIGSGVDIKVPSITGAKKEMHISGYSSTTRSIDFPVYQKVYVDEGATWTITDGNVIKVLGELQIDGKIIVQNGGELVLGGTGIPKATASVADSITVDEGGELEIVNCDVTVNGKLDLNGKLTTTAGKLQIKGEATVGSTGTLGSNTSKFTYEVASKASLTVNGYLDATEIKNSGSVVIDNSGITARDSAVASATSIAMASSGATVSVKSYLVEVADDSLTITDAGLSLGKIGGSDRKIGTQTDANTIVLNASDVAKMSGELVFTELTETSTSGSVKTYRNILQMAGSISNTTTPATTGGNPEPVTLTVGKTDASSAATIDNAAFESYVSIPADKTLTVAKDVPVAVDGVLNVYGYVDMTATQTSGVTYLTNSGTTTVEGKVKINGQAIAGNGVLNAAHYVTKEGTPSVTYNVYSSLSAAVVDILDESNTNTDKTITIYGRTVVSGDVVVKSPISIKFATGSKDTSSLVVSETGTNDATMTIEDGAKITSQKYQVVVNGTLTIADKETGDKTTKTVCDVTITSDDAKDIVYTNIYTALATATSGSTVNVTREVTDDTQYVELYAPITVGEGVTLVVGEKVAPLYVKTGVTLYVNGTLQTAQDITAEQKFGTQAMNVSGNTAKQTSAIVVNGTLKTASAVTYGNCSSSDAQSMIAGAPIAGAYYSIDKWEVISTMEIAQSNYSKIKSSAITVHGAIVSGDLSFAKGSSNDCVQITVPSEDVTAPGESTKIYTSLTFTTLTVDEFKLVAVGAVTGSVVNDSASVELSSVKGSSTDNAVAYDASGKLVLTGTVSSGTVKATKGTVYAGTTTVQFTTTGTSTKASVASGATLEGVNANLVQLTVNGTLNIETGESAIIENMTVLGAVKVASGSDTSAGGSLALNGTIGVGIAASDVKATTAASASVSGPVTFGSSAIVIVKNGAVVDDDAMSGLSNFVNTEFYVEGALWITVYAASGNSTKISSYADHDIENAYFKTWKNESGTEVKDNFIGASPFKKVYADVEYEVFHIILKADEGIDNVTITDGTNVIKLGKGMVYTDSTGIYYNAFTATVKAGSYTVSFTLKNGYAGDAKLIGDGVSGMTFKAAGTPDSEDGITIGLQLTGIEKSGYVQPAEEKDDSGMGITDYLLIVLVILVVVLAVIVALRLMRS